MHLFSFLVLLQVLSMYLSKSIDSIQTSIFVKNSISDTIKDNRILSKFPKKSYYVPSEKTKKLKEYAKHIQKLGMKTLKHTGNQIKKEINGVHKTTKIITSLSNHYSIKIQQYLDQVIKTFGPKSGYYFDMEFMYLNILETAFEFLYREQWQLVSNVTAKLYSIKNVTENIQHISKAINKQNIKWKNEEMKYICKKYEVCRSYPAFTDYLDNFVVELLSLPDERLKTILKLVKSSIATNNEYLAIFSDVQRKEIREKLEHLCNSSSVKEMLTTVRTILNQRYKILHIPDLVYGAKIQATRALLDIIDTAFNYDDNIFYEFDITVKAIKLWNLGEMKLPRAAVDELVSKSLTIINMIQNPTRDALIKAIVGRKARNTSLDKSILKQGVRGVYA